MKQYKQVGVHNQFAYCEHLLNKNELYQFSGTITFMVI